MPPCICYIIRYDAADEDAVDVAVDIKEYYVGEMARRTMRTIARHIVHEPRRRLSPTASHTS